MSGERRSLGDWLVRFFAPSTPWIVVFLLGIGALVGFGTYTMARIARDEAVHAADQHARETAVFVQCLGSRKPLHRFNRKVRGDLALVSVFLTNSRAQLEATPKHDPLRKVREQSYRRLKDAARDERALSTRAGVGFPIPNVKQCHALAHPARSKPAVPSRPAGKPKPY